jgi:hypothetical protein
MPKTSTFNQTGQTVGTQTNVETVEGDLNIGQIGTQTSPAQMRRTIAALQAEVAGLQGIPLEVRTQLKEALDGAVDVEQGALKGKLDSAGNALSGAAARLDGADDIAQKAFKLAKTVFSIGKWVIAAVAI